MDPKNVVDLDAHRGRRSTFYLGAWEGGFVRPDVDGKTAWFVIRASRGGRRYNVSTRISAPIASLVFKKNARGKAQLDSALPAGVREQLARFNADPEAYSPAGPERAPEVYLDDALAETFLKAHSHNTRTWWRQKRTYLNWLQARVGKRDLRKLTDADLIAFFNHKHREQQRIAVVKNFINWVKGQGILAKGEGPELVLTGLKAPKAEPEQFRRSKVTPKATLLAVRDYLLNQTVRGKETTKHMAHALTVQMGTGLHVSEVIRFAQAGSLEDSKAGEAGVIVVPRAKAGNELRVSVSQEVLEAARALREHGTLSLGRYHVAIKAACKKLKLGAFTPGTLRHTVATHAIEAGADLASVSTFLNHRSPATTKRFYSTHAVAKKVPTLL